MPRTGFIDHIGIGVPDLPAANRYYYELMPILGLRACFPTSAAGEFNYGPDGARGTQIFFYQALEPSGYYLARLIAASARRTRCHRGRP